MSDSELTRYESDSDERVALDRLRTVRYLADERTLQIGRLVDGRLDLARIEASHDVALKQFDYEMTAEEQRTVRFEAEQETRRALAHEQAETDRERIRASAEVAREGFEVIRDALAHRARVGELPPGIEVDACGPFGEVRCRLRILR